MSLSNNIPIYRAKKIDSDEYVKGYYIYNHVMGEYEDENADEREEWVEHFIISNFSQDVWEDDEGYFNHNNSYQIEPSTLSIHFPDMLDNQGNKIFASLSENGKGGDIVSHKNDNIKHFELLYFKGAIRRFFPFSGNLVQQSEFSCFKVIGIKG